MSEASEILAATIKLGESRSDLKRSVSDLEGRKEKLQKEVKQIERDKTQVLAADEKDLADRKQLCEKSWALREKQVCKKEKDIEERVVESLRIEQEQVAFKNAKAELKGEQKKIAKLKTELVENNHLADLKQEQLDMALKDANVSPKKIAAAIKAKEEKKKVKK